MKEHTVMVSDSVMTIMIVGWFCRCFLIHPLSNSNMVIEVNNTEYTVLFGQECAFPRTPMTLFPHILCVVSHSVYVQVSHPLICSLNIDYCYHSSYFYFRISKHKSGFCSDLHNLFLSNHIFNFFISAVINSNSYCEFSSGQNIFVSCLIPYICH